MSQFQVQKESGGKRDFLRLAIVLNYLSLAWAMLQFVTASLRSVGIEEAPTAKLALCLLKGRRDTWDEVLQACTQLSTGGVQGLIGGGLPGI